MEVICLDTNILIEHKRATKKDTTRLYQLSLKYSFAVCTVTAYELYRGDNSNEDVFWSKFFSQVTMLDFTLKAALEAGRIYKHLKLQGMMIDVEDILIGAIAISNHLKLATDNQKHFGRVEGLIII